MTFDPNKRTDAEVLVDDINTLLDVEMSIRLIDTDDSNPHVREAGNRIEDASNAIARALMCLLLATGPIESIVLKEAKP